MQRNTLPAETAYCHVRLALLFVLVPLLAAACSDQAAPTMPSEGILESAASSGLLSFDQANTTFTVSPTGADDTDNIQAALDGCVAEGPGCTVELTEGTFQTGMWKCLALMATSAEPVSR
ncbi:MAG: hypothetical protein ACYTA3_00520 [Planctomycetota bacterium]